MALAVLIFSEGFAFCVKVINSGNTWNNFANGTLSFLQDKPALGESDFLFIGKLLKVQHFYFLNIWFKFYREKARFKKKARYPV